MRRFEDLPALQEAAQRARVLAQQVVDLFEDGVTEHHQQEEDQLFDAVRRAARAGPERGRVQALVDQLTAEHRRIEAPVAAAAAPGAAGGGRSVQVPQDGVEALVQAYTAHTGLEEREFLPLAADILGRNDNQMAALGLALHMRHAHVPPAHI